MAKTNTTAAMQAQVDALTAGHTQVLGMLQQLLGQQNRNGADHDDDDGADDSRIEYVGGLDDDDEPRRPRNGNHAGGNSRTPYMGGQHPAAAAQRRVPRDFKPAKNLDVRSLHAEYADTIMVSVDDGSGRTRKLAVSPKIGGFSSGSIGWHTSSPVLVEMGGEVIECQANIMFIVKGTKPGKAHVKADDSPVNNAIDKGASDKAAGRKRKATRSEVLSIVKQYRAGVMNEPTARGVLLDGGLSDGQTTAIMDDDCSPAKAKGILTAAKLES